LRHRPRPTRIEWNNSRHLARVPFETRHALHDGRNVLDVLPTLAILIGYGALSFAVALRVFRYADT